MEKNSQNNEKEISYKEEYWWDYSLDWFGIHEPKNAKSKDENITELKELGNQNQSIKNNGQFHPSYASYIRPKEILSQQIPVSTNPEERVFIIVHEMYELAFKQMIFDLDIVSRTLTVLNKKKSDEFLSLIKLDRPANYEQYSDVKLFSIVQEYSLPKQERLKRWQEKDNAILKDIKDEKKKNDKIKEIKENREKELFFAKNYVNIQENDYLKIDIEAEPEIKNYIEENEKIHFWQAAYFASNRLLVNAEKVLSALSCLLDISAFSGLQFSQFRPLLLPASGFQTEQFRTVQMILGRTKCFNPKYFGMHEYLKKYVANKYDDAWKNTNDLDDAMKAAENLFHSVIDKRLYQRNETDTKRDWENEHLKNSLKKVNEIEFESLLCKNVTDLLENVNKSALPQLTEREIPDKINNSDAVLTHRYEAFKYSVGIFLEGSDFLSKPDEVKKDNKYQIIQHLKNAVIIDPVEKNYYEHWKNFYSPAQREGMKKLVDNCKDTFALQVLRNLSLLDNAIHSMDNTKRNKDRTLRTSLLNRPYFSFLERHLDFIDNQIGIVMAYERGSAIAGSGGGGKNYFEFAMRLYDLFPAFPAVDEYIVK